jgi:hypothetical protein
LRYTERGQRGRITRRDDRDPDPQAGWSEAEAMVYGGRLDFTLRRPVVGLSMLSEQPVDEVQLEAGWMLPLMHAGATALVGPRWPVPPETDQLFYRTFYELIREAGLPLGWAAWEARDRVRAAFPHRPDWLAYAYFGHPWCQPYRVRAAGGFALFEAINHPEGKPFETGQHYTFRASYRSEAPDWYEGRLRRQEASVEGNGLSVLVMKLNGEAPETYPLERVPAGESFQCMVRLAMPEQETRLPVLIRFQRGDEELQSLVMNLDVKEM